MSNEPLVTPHVSYSSTWLLIRTLAPGLGASSAVALQHLTRVLVWEVGWICPAPALFSFRLVVEYGTPAEGSIPLSCVWMTSQGEGRIPSLFALIGNSLVNQSTFLSF